MHMLISTHTPARGVTKAVRSYNSMFAISTHTPARGVTLPFLFLLPAGEDFYSHAREGRDPKSMVNLFWFIISTHTPARGVTLQRQRVAMNCNFYSHAREGRDRSDCLSRP